MRESRSEFSRAIGVFYKLTAELEAQIVSLIVRPQVSIPLFRMILMARRGNKYRGAAVPKDRVRRRLRIIRTLHPARVLILLTGSRRSYDGSARENQARLDFSSRPRNIISTAQLNGLNETTTARARAHFATLIPIVLINRPHSRTAVQ